MVTCPTCQTTLSVRHCCYRAQVRCKQCDETFLVSNPSAGDMTSLVGQPDRSEVETDRDSPPVRA